MDYLNSNDIDFATITETWLTENNNYTTSVIKDFGYDLMHIHRKNRVGGGVAILYKNLNVKPAKKLVSVDSFEYYACTIELKNQRDINVICVYRPGPPKSGVYDFCTELETVIEKHIRDEGCIVTGDFNIYYELDDCNKHYLWSSTTSFGLTQLVPNVAMYQLMTLVIH